MRDLTLATLFKWLALLLVLGVAAGLVWAWLANPAEWQVTAQGASMDEQAARGRFAVVATFVLIGIAVALLWGLIAGWAMRDSGWLLVPVFALGATVAALLAWRVGVFAGPPDPGTVGGKSVGDTIPQQLAVDAVAPFLVWPIFSLVGLFVAICSAGDRGDEGSRHRDEISRTESDIESTPAT